MKVLIIQGSPRTDGNCAHLIQAMVDVFASCNVETEIINVGNQRISGCLACGYCATHDGQCVITDIVSETHPKLKQADGLVVVSPVYFASPNGTLISFLDRLFHSGNYDLSMKVAAGFAVARRGGTETTFDVLNKYFTIKGMPIASGDYWNNGFGGAKGEIEEDKEGLRNARVVAKRMVFLMNAIKDAKEKYASLLEKEPSARTNFIH